MLEGRPKLNIDWDDLTTDEKQLLMGNLNPLRSDPLYDPWLETWKSFISHHGNWTMDEVKDITLDELLGLHEEILHSLARYLWGPKGKLK
jgi:hypothetical protein